MEIRPNEWFNIPKPIMLAFKSIIKRADYTQLLIEELNIKANKTHAWVSKAQVEALETAKTQANEVRVEMNHLFGTANKEITELRKEVFGNLNKQNNVLNNFGERIVQIEDDLTKLDQKKWNKEDGFN